MKDRLIKEIADNLERMRGASFAAHMAIRKLMVEYRAGDSRHDELAAMIHTCQRTSHLADSFILTLESY